MKRLLLTLALALLASVAFDGHAHELGESYVFLRIYDDSIEGRFEITLCDLNEAMGFVGTEDEITEANFDSRIDWLKAYYSNHVGFSVANEPRQMRITSHDYWDVFCGYARMDFVLDDLGEVPPVLTIDYSVLFDENPDHRAFLVIEHSWRRGTFENEKIIEAMFKPDDRRQDLDLTDSSLLRGFIAVARFGVDHIWSGADHIMFLLALIFPSVLIRVDGKWEPVERFPSALLNVVKIVTCFTIAHSLTLSAAALQIVSLPSRLVESVIAASIAIAAAGILVPILERRVLLVVMVFGLFHGFGFAGGLADLGLLGDHLTLTLLAFNVGVEIGQVVIVAAVFPLLFLVRRTAAYRKLFINAVAAALILQSGVWFVERVFDIDIPTYGLVKPLVDFVLAG